MGRVPQKSDAAKIADGRGQGDGTAYKPWFHVREVPSLGTTLRIVGWKSGRLHQLLSQHEARYFYVLEWADSVVNIFDQIALLPVSETVQIAKELGVRHPRQWRSSEPAVMTTDFLPVAETGGKRVRFARDIKPDDELDKPRNRELFAIRQVFWTRRGIDFGAVRSSTIPTTLADNVRRIHAYRSRDSVLLDDDALRRVAAQLTERVLTVERSVADIAAECDRGLSFRTGTSLSVVKHLLAIKDWPIDMSQPIDFCRPMRLLSRR